MGLRCAMSGERMTLKGEREGREGRRGLGREGEREGMSAGVEKEESEGFYGGGTGRLTICGVIAFSDFSLCPCHSSMLI